MSTASLLRELLGPAVLLRWPARSKGDYRKWKHLRLDDMTDSYLAKVASGGNVGVALGRVSEGLITIDLDQDDCAETFLQENPLLTNTLQTRARRGCNIWIRCAGAYPPSCKLKNTSGDEVGEWRADGCQTIVSGIHPDGMPYRFIVEKPVITISYDAIIWPSASVVAPNATESKRVRGVREQEVVSGSLLTVVGAGCRNGNGAAGAKDCLQIQAFLAGNDSIRQLAPTARHQNNSSLFKLARLLINYERAIGRSANETEKEFMFARWAERARQFWRPEFEWDDYYAEFLVAYSYARIGLDEDPIELAVSRAKDGPLPEPPGGFKGERVRLLVAICRELQKTMGTNPIYLPTRKLGDILRAHWTSVANWLRVLEAKQIIQLAPGEVRKRGSERSPRYYYRRTLDLSQTA